MSKAVDIIIRPIITEKTTLLSENNNTITFEVKRGSNKTEVRQAVEELFKVKVAKVNIVNVLPKKKRLGQYLGKTRGIRKAYVTLVPGHTIDIFAEL
ncbi:MAG: 50S ribosomal protein L23 [Bacilli bacterium]